MRFQSQGIEQPFFPAQDANEFFFPVQNFLLFYILVRVVYSHLASFVTEESCITRPEANFFSHRGGNKWNINLAAFSSKYWWSVVDSCDYIALHYSICLLSCLVGYILTYHPQKKPQFRELWKIATLTSSLERIRWAFLINTTMAAAPHPR